MVKRTIADSQRPALIAVTAIAIAFDMSQSDDDDDRSSSSSWSDDESSLDTRSNDESSWRSDSEYEPSSESGSDYESSCCSESSCDSGSSKEKAALSDQELNAHCHIPLPIEVWECILLHLHEKDLLRMRKVSKLHRSITQSTAFQSRYLLKCYSKCEAIYEATCRPKLFNGQLLRVRIELVLYISKELTDFDSIGSSWNGRYHVKTFRTMSQHVLYAKKRVGSQMDKKTYCRSLHFSHCRRCSLIWRNAKFVPRS